MMRLLPNNHTSLEVTLEDVVHSRFELESDFTPLNQPAVVDPALLPWLAWQFSVDVWDATWPEAAQRNTVANALKQHQVKGSIGSVTQALADAGYGDATVLERSDMPTFNGTRTHNGTLTYGTSIQWAEYRITIPRPITLDQKQQIEAILALTAPARCHLTDIDFTQAALRHDGARRYDGTYSHGTV